MKKAVAFLQSLREQALTRKMYESNFIFNGYTIHIMSQPAIAQNIQRGKYTSARGHGKLCLSNEIGIVLIDELLF